MTENTVGEHLAQMREAGELAVAIEPRCRICRRPDVRERVNRMLSAGFTLTAIVEALEGLNASLPAKARVTVDSLHKHRMKHYNVQAGANAVWRRMLEEADQSGFESSVASLVTPMSFFQVLMSKGYAALAAEDTVTIDQAALAARELHKMTRDGGDDAQRWAEVHAKQAKIVAVFREFIPPERHQEFLDRLEGRSPPPGGARRALVGGGRGDDGDGFDPLDDDGDDDFDDDD